MLAATHVVAGAALGSPLAPPFAFIAGMLSHLLLDTIPHWNFYVFPRGPWRRITFCFAAFDLILGLTLLCLFSSPLSLSAFLGAGGGIVIDLPSMWFRWRGKCPALVSAWKKFHYQLQHETARVGWGLAPQIIVILISLLWLR
jgi:hypothetical protein